MKTHIPAGWKLVPIEPTDEMEAAAENDYEQTGATFPRWKSAYAAMLAAAPEAPPITVALDPDPRGVSVGVWQGSSCIYSGAHAVPAPAAGDVRDAKRYRALHWLAADADRLQAAMQACSSRDMAEYTSENLNALADAALAALAAQVPQQGEA